MATYNFVVDGSFVNISGVANTHARLHNSSQAIEWVYDGSGDLVFSIDDAPYLVKDMSDVIIDGVTLSDPADFETNIKLIFPGYAGGGGWGTTGTVATLTGASTLAMATNTFNFSNGMVGIGVTPTVALDVVGDFRVVGTSAEINSGTASGLMSGGSTTTIGDYNGNVNNTFINVVDDTQDIELRSATTTISNLAGTGSRAVLADASGVLSAPVSDRSTKQNIQPLENGLDLIMKLKPSTFEFKEGWKNYGEGTQVGFIAQEIQEVLPNSVFTTPSTDKLGYNEIDIVPLLVKAVQELKKEIEELKKLK